MGELWARFCPSHTEKIVGAGSAIGGLIWEYTFGHNDAIGFLVAAMCIDYITGMLAAYIYKRKHPRSKKGLDSRVGAIGILKKILILCMVALSHILDNAVSFDGIEAAVTWFYIGNEALSVVENAAKCGTPMPKKLLDVLEQLAGEKERAEKSTRKKAARSDEKDGTQGNISGDK